MRQTVKSCCRKVRALQVAAQAGSVLVISTTAAAATATATAAAAAPHHHSFSEL